MTKVCFNVKLIVSALFVWINVTDCSVPYNDTKFDYETLLSAYRTANSLGTSDVVPKDLSSGPVTVYTGISLYAIMNFDAVSGEIQLVTSMKMEWLDEVKTLTGTTFRESLQTIFVPYDQIWTPDLVLMSSVDSVKRIGDETYKVRYNVSSGYCKWYPRMIINAACAPDMTYYPFDKQTCTLTVTPWNYDVTQTRLVPLTNEWNTENVERSGTWSVDETSTEAHTTNNNTRSNVDFKITIKRKPLFLALVIVLPVLLLSLLSGFLLLLPPGSGERVGFSITCFLSFVVVLQTIMSFMPQVSSPMSILCFYVIVMLSFSIFLSITNIFLLRMYLNPSKEGVPGYFFIVLELITCKVWKRCPKCPEVKFTFLRKMWQRCRKSAKLRFDKGYNTVDFVHNTRFSVSLAKLKKTSEARHRFISEQETQLIKEDDSDVVDKLYEDRPNVADKPLLRSTTWCIGIENFDIGDEDNVDTKDKLFPFARSKSAPAFDCEMSTATEVCSAKSSGYLSATSSYDNSAAASKARSASGSTSLTATESKAQSASGSGSLSATESKAQSASGSGSLSAIESKPHSASGSRCQSADKSRKQSTSSEMSSPPDSKSDITWEYIAQMLDLFFLAVFCIVQIIFTIFFLVPLGAQY